MAVSVAMAVGVEQYGDDFVWSSARAGRWHSGSHGTQENGRQGYADGHAHGLPYTWQRLVALLVKICRLPSAHLQSYAEGLTIGIECPRVLGWDLLGKSYADGIAVGIPI
jgi:hypothetical protein